jgi:hypothetical protein
LGEEFYFRIQNSTANPPLLPLEPVLPKILVKSLKYAKMYVANI